LNKPAAQEGICDLNGGMRRLKIGRKLLMDTQEVQAVDIGARFIYEKTRHESENGVYRAHKKGKKTRLHHLGMKKPLKKAI